jgi:hypothetical protein
MRQMSNASARDRATYSLHQSAGRVLSALLGNTQYTVFRDDSLAPRWQLFAGVNLQFPIGQ